RGRKKGARRDTISGGEEKMYEDKDGAGQKPGQLFFRQVQLHGGKYRHNKNWKRRALSELGGLTRPEEVTLPPYYPRDPVLLDDWAQYLDTARYTDKEVGEVIARLEREGILDQTVIILMTDHGISHAREKQFLYDGGIHVPF